MFFAVTLKCNHRNGFPEDLDLLRRGIDYLKFGFQDGTKKKLPKLTIYPYQFELQPQGIHNMHVHLCLETERLDFSTTHYVMKQMDLNCDIQIIEDHPGNWIKYCVKEKGDLAMDYAESHSESRDNIKVTAQQMGHSKNQIKNELLFGAGLGGR